MEPGEVTLLLEGVRSGDQYALARLIPVVYQDLRRLAAYHMRQQGPGHTLQPTALVHEVYLRLAGQHSAVWSDREHFFASAALIMRNLLVDHARARQRAKRGGGEKPVVLEDALSPEGQNPDDVLILDQALERLAAFDARAARAVELRYFTGLSIEEVASVTGVSERTVKRDWNSAMAWLKAELRESRKEVP